MKAKLIHENMKAKLIHENLNEQSASRTDVVKDVLEILKKADVSEPIDIRITYTRTNVKANIQFLGSSEKQTTKFSNVHDALLNCLTSYKDHVESGIEYYQREDIYVGHLEKFKLSLQERSKKLQIILPFINEAIDYLK